MNKNWLIGGAIVLIVLAAIGLYFYASKAYPTTNSGGSSQSVATNKVTAQNYSFTPANITIKAGDTVTWTNKDGVTHHVVSDTSAFDLGDLNAGASYTHTFSDKGTFPYHCAIHTEMTGTITVN